MGGGFKHFLCSLHFTPILGEMIQIEKHIFLTGLKPPGTWMSRWKLGSKVRINGLYLQGIPHL